MLAKGFVIFNKKWLIPFLPLTFLNYTYKICIHSQKAQQNRWRQTAVTTFSYCHASPSSDVTGTPSSQAVMVNSMVSIIPLHAFTSQRLRNIVPFYWSQSPNHFSSHFNKMQVRSMASKIPVIWLLSALLSLPFSFHSQSSYHTDLLLFFKHRNSILLQIPAWTCCPLCLAHFLLDLWSSVTSSKRLSLASS